MEHLLPNMQNDEEAAPLRPREAAEEAKAIRAEVIEKVFGPTDRLCNRCAKFAVALGCATTLAFVGLLAYQVGTHNSATPYNITQ